MNDYDNRMCSAKKCKLRSVKLEVRVVVPGVLKNAPSAENILLLQSTPICTVVLHVHTYTTQYAFTGTLESMCNTSPTPVCAPSVSFLGCVVSAMEDGNKKYSARESTKEGTSTVQSILYTGSFISL